MPKHCCYELHARISIAQCIEFAPPWIQEPLNLNRDRCLEILGAPLYPHGQVMSNFQWANGVPGPGHASRCARVRDSCFVACADLRGVRAGGFQKVSNMFLKFTETFQTFV